MVDLDLLKKEIDIHGRSLKTEKISFSIGELKNLYLASQPKIIINPEFQRLFRWGKKQKSKLIESIFLKLPIPPIFLSEKEDGSYELIDGLQRLSTIFEFMGILKEEGIPFLKEKYIKNGLLSGEYLTNLNGLKWEELDETLENKFLFYRIDANIIIGESDTAIAKYDLFDRLNSLSSQASNQEVRNALLIMGDPSFFKWIQSLSDFGDYKELVTEALPEKDVEQSFNLEMILRFFSIKNYAPDITGNVSNIGEFINENTKTFLLSDFDRIEQEKIFKYTFSAIKNRFGTGAFKRYEDGKSSGRFVLPAFDLIAGGIGYNYENSTLINEEEIKGKIESIWTDLRYDKELGSKSGVSSEGKIKNATIYGRELFHK